MRGSIFFAIIMMSSMSYGQDLELEEPLRFLALGDSYTIGESVPKQGRWPLQLLDSLTAIGFNVDTVEVIAQTGWRTDDLQKAITQKQPPTDFYNLVSLLIGVNNQYQGGNINTYSREFEELLLTAIGIAGGEKKHVFVVSIPDYAYTPFGQSRDPQKISQEIDKYNEVNREISDMLGVVWINITPVSRKGLQTPALIAKDGLHPSEIQYSEWVEIIVDQFSELLAADAEDGNMEITISPNPFTNYISLQSRIILGGKLTLYSSMGELVLEKSIETATLSICTESLPPGQYWLIIRDEEQRIRYRRLLVKQ